MNVGNRADGPLLYERDATLARLEAALATARTGHLALVTLTGEAGIGKSSLLTGFASGLQVRDPAPLVAYGRALAANSVGNGFQPLREALNDVVERESRKTSRRLKNLLGHMRAVAPEWLAAIPAVGDVAKAIAITAGLGAPSEKTSMASMNAQLVALIRTLTEDGANTLALLLDDLHWADESTVDALFFVSQHLIDCRLLLVMAFRPSDLQIHGSAHPLRAALLRMERYNSVTHIELQQLGPNSILSLTQTSLAVRPSPRLTTWLMEQSDGNPLFVHEFLALLREKLRSAGRPVTQQCIDDLINSVDDIPRRLAVVIDERLESLTDDEYRTLQVASIVGPDFEVADVAGLSDLDSKETHQALRSLTQRTGIVRAVSRGKYMFHHGLVQEHVVQRLCSEDRGEFEDLHYRRAMQLLGQPGENLRKMESVAFHLHQANEHEAAYVHAVRVAAEARRFGAISESAIYYSWAVEHSDALGATKQRALTREALASVKQEMISTQDAVALLEDAVKIGAASLTGPEDFSLVINLARAYRMEEMWDSARAVLSRARGLAVSTTDEKAARAIIELMSGELLLSGQPRDVGAAEEHFRVAEVTAVEPFVLASVQGHLGFVALATGDAVRAEERFVRAREYAYESNRPGRIYEAHLWLEKFRLATMNLTAAGDELAAMKDLADRYGIAGSVAHHLRDAGRRAALLGDVSTAKAMYLAYLERMLAVPTDAWRIRASAYIFLQARELVEERGAPAAVQMAFELASHIREQLEPSQDTVRVVVQLETIGAALQGRMGVAQALRTRGVGHFLDSPVAEAARWVFTFHIPDLYEFRRQHRV